MNQPARRRFGGILTTTLLLTLATACGGPGETGQAAELSDAQLEELVRRSYQ